MFGISFPKLPTIPRGGIYFGVCIDLAPTVTGVTPLQARGVTDRPIKVENAIYLCTVAGKTLFPCPFFVEDEGIPEKVSSED